MGGLCCGLACFVKSPLEYLLFYFSHLTGEISGLRGLVWLVAISGGLDGCSEESVQVVCSLRDNVVVPEIFPWLQQSLGRRGG